MEQRSAGRRAFPHTSHLTPHTVVAILSLLAGLLTGPAFLLAAPSAGGTGATEFLYRIAQDYRKAGDIDQAIHELHKLLLLTPNHEPAKRELALLESLKQS